MINLKKYFPALTGLRAIAAYLVFFHHALPYPNSSVFWHKMVFAGYTGVTLFFVLSGFLITYQYNKFSGSTSYNTYLVKRFARIYPLYFLWTLLILLWQKDFELLHWFLNITLLKGFFDAYKFSGIGPGWSLTVEACFYILAPILFIMFRRNGFVTITMLILTGSTLVVFAKAYYATSFVDSLGFMLDFTFFGHCFEFYCGYLVAHYYRELATLPQKNYYTTAGFLLTLLGFGLIAWTSDQVWFVENNKAIMYSIGINNFCLPVVIGLLLFGLITENTILSRLLSTNFFQIVGKSSYAFFLIHSGIAYEVFYFHLLPNKWIIFLALNALAILLYYAVERPLYFWITKKALT
ncbi:acyltransferase family protein [Adhaeribacter pallidiroseus]|uniref:Acyltransferase 3 domain-containing protein n=1 Tax=Adhaeribacter pallidiroseus TaxID=2072847 RepID=A0A369QAE8_9BACT|nr:acyltransferase [Adhaeribacter pallidiroseus]RDC61881.1 hypothetical protein AHMF7616_00470 [Adhaeribacter pallidiroseus]